MEDKKNMVTSNKHKQHPVNTSGSSVQKKPKMADRGYKLDESTEKYARGALKYSTRNVAHKGLRKTISETQENILESAHRTAATEVLLTSETGSIEVGVNEKVYKYKQEEIKQSVDLNAAKNVFDLQLTSFGPYNVKYNRNGRSVESFLFSLSCIESS